MRLDDIEKEWKNDCEINELDIQRESIRGSRLREKYLSLLIKLKRQLTGEKNNYNRIREIRSRYYWKTLTEEELEEYKWEPYQRLKPAKSDMKDVLDADSVVIKYKSRVENFETAVYQLESILRDIRDREWQIKNYIDWKRYESGA